MAGERVRYETRTVKSVRGLEARTIAKLEQEGWEIVSRTQGRLKSDIHVRRAVRPVSRRTIAFAGGGAAALALVIVLGATGVFGGDEEDSSAAATRSALTGNASKNVAASVTPTADPLLTESTSPELAALLQIGDYCDDSIAPFAEKYAGRTVSFDGSIGAMGPHGSAKTRFDILIGAGNFSTTTAVGPAFQFRDVNTVSDLHYVGDIPDAIGVGTNLQVTATVGEYQPTQCLFQLTPVETVVR